MGLVVRVCNKCGASMTVDSESNEAYCEKCRYEMSNNINNNQMNYQQPPMSNMNNNKKKKKKNKKKLFLYILFSLIIIASGIVFYIDYTERNKIPDELNELFDKLPSEIETKDEDKSSVQVESALLNLAPDVDLNEERARNNNNEIIGRLEIPDLFNVLVTKGSNNEYYLSHSVQKKYDIRGTEFLDYRLTTTSKQLNIYGHNTRDEKIKVAFLKLEKFLKQDFFDSNPYIVFQHDGGKNIYKILAIKEIRETNNEHMFIDYTGDAFVEHVKKMTTGEGVYNTRDVHYDENSEIIVLQTCSHHWKNGFYTVIAVKI